MAVLLCSGSLGIPFDPVPALQPDCLFLGQRHASLDSTLLVRLACGALIAVHLVLAPIGVLLAPINLADFREIFARSASSFPGDGAVAGQQVLVVSTPTAFVSQFALLMRALDDGSAPSGSLVLGSSIHEIQVSRSGPHTLVLRPRGGFLLPPGRTPEGAEQLPPFDRRYAYSLFGRVESWRGSLSDSVSNSRLIKRSMRFSRTTLSCTFRVKGYETYRAEAAFDDRM